MYLNKMPNISFYFPLLFIILIYTSISFVYADTFNNTFYKSSCELERNEIEPWIPVEGRVYKPNSVYMFQILNCANMTNSNIRIAIDKLEIDSEMEEYVLVGDGPTPFEGSPPLFITSISGKKKILVKDEQAYVVFVSGHTRQNYSGYHITWEYIGEEKKEEIRNDDILESVPICFRNVIAVRNELSKSIKEDWFKDFRMNFSEIAVASYPKRRVKLESVSIFHISGIARLDDSSEVVYARLKVSKDSEKGRAAFKYSELEGILVKYIEQHSGNGTDKYQTCLCPTRKMGELWTNEPYYLIVPVICIVFLFLFTWKQNPVNEYFAKKKRIQRASRCELDSPINCKEDCTNVKQNTVENPYSTMPKLEVTNVHGRRFTLKLTDSLIGTEVPSEDETFNQMMLSHKRYSDVYDLQRPQLAENLFSSMRGEENRAYVTDEEGRSVNQGVELTEHVYDSVESKPGSSSSDIMVTPL